MEKTLERPLVGWMPRHAPQSPRGNASVHLDALRGLAAFCVMLGHWRDAFFLDYSKLPHHNPLLAPAYLVTGLGRQWVIVFFVLSGYLVGGSVLRSAGNGRWSWRAYFTARLTRLYIVLIPALVIGGALDWCGMRLTGSDIVYRGVSGMNSLLFDVHKTLTPAVFAGNLAFLQTIALPGIHDRMPAFGSNGPLWSLSNEFWYYMAFPPLVFLIMGSRPALQRLLYLAIIVLMGWFCGAGICFLFIPWLIGSLVGYLPAFPTHRSWLRHSAIAGALFLFVACISTGRFVPERLSDLMIGASVAFLISVTLHYANGDLPDWYIRLARRAAHTSYTLYLVHMPLLVFLKAFFRIPRSAPNLISFTTAASVLIVILVYAQIIAFCFERNTDRIRAWLKPGRVAQ